MAKENRVNIKLVALWIVFVVALGLGIWSMKNFTVAIAKSLSGGYVVAPMFSGAGYGGNYCLQYPVMPQPYMDATQGQNEKYMAELEEYNKKFQEACQTDMAKQEMIEKNQEIAASVADLASATILALLSTIVAATSFSAIKNTEEV